MQYRILGPLEIRTDDGWRGIRAAKWRALLAVLLLRSGQVVPVDLLVDELWSDGATPAGARKLVSGYVFRLRALLGDATGRVLVTRPPGYQLLADPADLDAARFAALVTDGRDALAQHDGGRAVALLEQALALWRGPALVDVAPGPLAARESDRLTELRREAEELHAEAALAAGRLSLATAELRRLTTEHPLHEHLWASLMRALRSAGRQAEALEVYARARKIIADELGADPGTDLQDLYRTILTTPLPSPITPSRTNPASPTGPTGPKAHDIPDVASSPHGPDGQWAQGGQDAAGGQGSQGGQRGPLVVPRQLPAAVAHLAGRRAALDRLTDLANGGGMAPVIAAIGGTAGVGKTALAVAWARQAGGRFPDGQLYVNLRGFDAAGVPITAAEAVRGFLDAFGVPADRVPVSVDAQVGLYRSLLAGQRVLVILDNARDAEQVRPLLPGSPGSMAVITSRAELAPLVASEGAHLLTLDPLTDDGARDLLDRYLGPDHTAHRPDQPGRPDVVAELVELCAGLPLALRIVAARAAARPHLPLGALVAELRDARGRLDALDAGGTHASARVVFSWSVRVLPPGAARMFRLLGLHPGPDITVPAAAAVAGVAVVKARADLAELARAHLVGEHAPGRYGCHDLLRAYAAEQVRARHGAKERDAATRRMYDHYLRGAYAAARTLGSVREFGSLPPQRQAAAPACFAGPSAAWGWLESEHRVLALVAQAAVATAPLHACRLAWMLVDFLDRRGYWPEYDAVARTALEAAVRHGDAEWQARAHRVVGGAHKLFGRYGEARESFQRAADLYGGTGNRAGQAHAYRMMGVVTGLRGRYHEALDEAERALALYRAAGHPGGRADVLNDIGWYRAHLGDAGTALRYCRSALDSQLELGNRHGTADAWDSLGYAHDRMGQHGPARDCYHRALALYRELGDRHFEANTLVRLGDSAHARGDAPAARAAWHEALVILDALTHPDAATLRRRLTQAGAIRRPATPAR